MVLDERCFFEAAPFSLPLHRISNKESQYTLGVGAFQKRNQQHNLPCDPHHHTLQKKRKKKKRTYTSITVHAASTEKEEEERAYHSG
jgi:hypothetical protein